MEYIYSRSRFARGKRCGEVKKMLDLCAELGLYDVNMINDPALRLQVHHPSDVIYEPINITAVTSEKEVAIPVVDNAQLASSDEDTPTEKHLSQKGEQSDDDNTPREKITPMKPPSKADMEAFWDAIEAINWGNRPDAAYSRHIKQHKEIIAKVFPNLLDQLAAQYADMFGKQINVPESELRKLASHVIASGRDTYENMRSELDVIMWIYHERQYGDFASAVARA